MADETTTTTTGTPDAAQNTDTTPDEKQPVPYDRFQKTIAEKNALKAQLEAITKEKDAAKAQADAVEAARLKEQGDFRKLYEDTSAKLPTLEAQAKNAATYEKVFTDLLGKRLTAVPEHIRSLLEKMPPIEALQWIEDNAETLKPSNPGSQSNRGGTVTTDNNAAEIAALTPLELQMAQMTNMSPSEYVQYRKMGDIQRQKLAEADVNTK
jgi:hypothetical protein